MDQIGSDANPTNPLPIKCPHCTFRDLDFVARPYLLAKGISSPTEISPAALGNFLVRERVKRVLQLVVPDACTYHSTADLKSKKAAPWWLAVPTRKLDLPVPKPQPPFCSKCGQPKQWCYSASEVWSKMSQFDSGGADIFKSEAWLDGGTAEDDFELTNRYRKEKGLPPLPWSNWGVEPPPHSERWTHEMPERDLYFSVRLEQLLKRIKVKGQLVRFTRRFKDVQPTRDDEGWIGAKLQLLAADGLVKTPKSSANKKSRATQTWFRQFLKRGPKKGFKGVDFAAAEGKQKLPLPEDYKGFIFTVGPKAFKNVNDIEGTITSVLPPQKLDFKNFRRGKVPGLEGEDAEVDGVLFAEMDNGDSFLFDVSVKGRDYPVYWYRHEENTLEPFAPNFAECIKRFVKKDHSHPTVLTKKVLAQSCSPATRQG